MGASFKFALVLLFLVAATAPTFAKASLEAVDRDLIKEVVEATLRAQDATKEAERMSFPLLLGNEKTSSEGLKACASRGNPCDPRIPNYCCSGRCTPFFDLFFVCT